MGFKGRDAEIRALDPVLGINALVDDVLDRRRIDVDGRALLRRRRRERHADLLWADGEINLLADLKLLVVVGADVRKTSRADRAVVAFRSDDLAGEKVGVADERGDETRRGRLVYLRGAVELFDRAAVDDRDAVGKRHRLALVVRDVHERDADLIVDRVELKEHVLAKLQVERSERLVKEQHLRTVDEGARDRDALLLAA